MALSLRRWLLAIAAGCGLFALLLLPPRGMPGGVRTLPWAMFMNLGWWREPEPRTRLDSLAQTRNRLQSEANALARLLTSRAWADTVVGRRDLLARARSGVPQLLLRDTAIPAALGDRIATRQARWWAALGARRADAWSVIVAIPPDHDGAAKQLPVGPFTNGMSVVLMPPAVPDGGCVILSRIRGQGVDYSLRRSLNICGFILTYGLPGPRIVEWLDETDWRAAETDPAFLQFELSAAERRGWARSWGLVAVARCMDGDADACLEALLHPERLYARPSAVAPGVLGLPGYGRGILTIGLHGMLARLEAEVGPERFARFWASEDSLPAALTEATGGPAKAWVQEFVAAQVGGEPRPDPLRLDSALPLLGWTGVGVGLALLLSGRRQVR